VRRLDVDGDVWHGGVRGELAQRGEGGIEVRRGPRSHVHQ
jgi:hypothetical protein